MHVADPFSSRLRQPAEAALGAGAGCKSSPGRGTGQRLAESAAAATALWLAESFFGYGKEAQSVAEQSPHFTC